MRHHARFERENGTPYERCGCFPAWPIGPLPAADEADGEFDPSEEEPSERGEGLAMRKESEDVDDSERDFPSS